VTAAHCWRIGISDAQWAKGIDIVIGDSGGP
nr:serine proteinase-like protein - Trypanosoma cruzi (fragments) [Trypanosoma cruzi]